MSASLLIAWRYLRSAHNERALSSMTLICFIGMALSSGALALVVSIMQGFEYETHRRLQGIHSPLIMQSHEHALDTQKIKEVLSTEFPAIQAASPSFLQQVVIQKKGNKKSHQVIFLKGVNPTDEQAVSTIGNTMLPTSPSFSTALHENSIALGGTLAENLNLAVGDTLDLIIPEDEDSGDQLHFTTVPARIGGIFKTGIAEFDEGLAYAQSIWIQKIMPDASCSHISLAIDPKTDESQLIAALKNRFHIDVYSWKELYTPLVSALKLEKYAMLLILLLIALIAGMNIVSLLYMHIVRKRSDIAILKTMGMPDSSIAFIFVIVGLAIAMAGSLCGLTIAALVALFLHQYPCIELPDTYYVTHLPIVLDPWIFVIIFGTVLFLSLLATLIPLRTLTTIHIAQILRFEG